jgi:hypothetical protein
VANNNRGRVPEQERCKGTSRQSKERCKRRRSPGSGYCIYHGGRVPKGGAHPNFKDGGRSRYMPPPLVENYERYFNDPDLTHHRDSIALVDVLVDEALGITRTGARPSSGAASRPPGARSRRRGPGATPPASGRRSTRRGC